jgi:trehalose-6-phosphate synthase
MLGADLVGFHTPTYLRHFATALTDILGLTVDIDRVPLPGREVRLGVFPMGIDAGAFETLAKDPAVEAEADALRGDGSVRILVGVDRLDYTKGIPRRLLTYERMLQIHPELREKVRLVQVAVPSRTGVEAYQEFRSLVDGLVGRINGAFGTPRWVQPGEQHRVDRHQRQVDQAFAPRPAQRGHETAAFRQQRDESEQRGRRQQRRQHVASLGEKRIHRRHARARMANSGLRDRLD